MAMSIRHFFSVTAAVLLAIVLACLIVLTPADAIYQCYVSEQLTNIFFITGAYVVTFLLAVMTYATRIYTNRTVLRGIPKAWIPVEREDVSKSVRRLVAEGLARSAIISFQARPRDLTADRDKFSNFEALIVNRDRPHWGHIEHPGWSSPSSLDFPDLPYRVVVRELPHLVEAKAVSLAPPDPLLSASRSELDLPSSIADQTIPDTRAVQVLQRPVQMGLREYIQHLTRLNVFDQPEVGAMFIALYDRARFAVYELHESEFRELMHVFAELLRGMRRLDVRALDEIRDGSSFDSESAIRPSDEEGETDSTDDRGDAWLMRSRSNSLRPSSASGWESRSARALSTIDHISTTSWQRTSGTGRLLTAPRTPSMQSLRRARSNLSGCSERSVIRLVETRRPSDLPYEIIKYNSGIGHNPL